MSFIIRARILLTDYSQMEQILLGEIEEATKKFLVWRRVAVEPGEVYRIVEYEKDDKTLVEMYDGTVYVVKEPFLQVTQNWTESRQQESQTHLTFTPEGEGDGENEESDS